MKFTLGKKERLKSRKLIAKLFEEGTSVKVFPLRLTYLQTEHTSKFPVQAGFSVPKRNFKKAVDRNQLKRLLREVYRKEKYIVYDSVDKPYVFMLTFIGRKSATYQELEQKIHKLLALFLKEINSATDENN